MIKIILLCFFIIFAFIIFWGMIGYSYSLKLISKIITLKPLHKDADYLPTVTVMIVAHNEERIIKQKLENVIQTSYPLDKVEFLVTSDNSDDRTNEIVEEFINTHSNYQIRLYVTKEHKGKTNAQNEAQKTVKNEILVMTDANSMFHREAIRELVCCFCDTNVAYVTGRLSYNNAVDNTTSGAEDTYWEGDLKQREVESGLHSVTAGNGAIYACRNSLYVDFDPIRCHDSAMPRFYAKQHLRSVYNPAAIAYEKAGESSSDEFKRKVRMNRCILTDMFSSFRYMNPFRFSWFAYCYFGHRFCRYSLWFAHIMLLAPDFG